MAHQYARVKIGTENVLVPYMNHRIAETALSSLAPGAFAMRRGDVHLRKEDGYFVLPDNHQQSDTYHMVANSSDTIGKHYYYTFPNTALFCYF